MSNNTQVTVLGITPAKTGKDVQYGNWFLIDQSGSFTVNRDIVATVWLVGGGCDGEDGTWEGYIAPVTTGTKVSEVLRDYVKDTNYRRGGYGGDGGCVYKFENVYIPQESVSVVNIAECNERTGTTAEFYGTEFSCNCEGRIATVGGDYATVGADKARKLTNPTKGQDGMETPYGYVGSSGGGGMACDGYGHATGAGTGGKGAGSSTDHRNVAGSATNYGCGGGGGGTCGFLGDKKGAGIPGGKGKKGCVIVQYKVKEKQLTVQKHYDYTCDTQKTCETDYASNNNHSSCCHNGQSSNYNVEYKDSINIRSAK